MQKTESSISSSNNFNLKEEVYKYLSQWKWFVLGVFLCLAVAYLYLRYSVPQYKANATILVKDDRKGGIANELSAFSDLGMLSNIKSNVDNEVEVIKSRTLIDRTIQDLELTTVYMNIGRVKSEELYKSYPVKMVVLKADENYFSSYKKYRIAHHDAASFKLYNDSDSAIGTFKYGEKIKVNEAVLQFIKTKDYSLNKEFNIAVNYYPKAQLVESFRNRLLVSTLSKNTSVIELSIVDPVKSKAVDFLNELVSNYNKDAIDDKKYVSENTSKFIDQRLELIAKELQGVEQDVEAFKKSNQVTDIVSEAGLFLENASEVEKQKMANLTQIKVVETMMDYVNSSDFSETLPANIIAQDQGATSLISDYNKLVLERNKLTKTAGEKNTLVKALDAKITSLKQNVKASLAQYKSSLGIQQQDLTRQKAKVVGKIAQIPTQERLFRDIDRKQHVKEALFLYLLQKREEMAISLAVTAPNAKVIDLAISSSVPVSPNRKVIYLGSFLLGILIPFGVIYINDLFDTKIKSRVDIERATTLPFLGEIPRLDTGVLLVENSSRSTTAEAMRIIRTNLEFLLNEVEEGTAKTIFLTSTYPKEGKTFVSVNLASIISQSNDKVLLIGADIRNPKLDDYMQLPQKGLTNFLADKTSAPINDFIVSSKEIPNLHVLPAGVIPPNPAELLMGSKLNIAFEELKKQYNYIIVDTAPVSLVTDTLIIAKNANAFVYVARANFLDKRMLELPQKLYSENKLPNMSILLNDTNGKKGYGYGYGYGYEAESESKKSWKNIFKK
ncbi:GumC family protein [Flavobacterium sp. N2270]|uniref:GumC family protein n=1 Tax=Flavobacterium sp. N2270 TaxID=2986831 RepID=UPI0022245B76|nr:polysaccharide biosynthesis tyrosine autokinase [Flavobacterium sp. N2270]